MFNDPGFHQFLRLLLMKTLAIPALCLALGALAAFWAAREYLARRRERNLELLVRQGARELAQKRVREQARHHILELLVSSRHLGSVLDGVATLAVEELNAETEGTEPPVTEPPVTNCMILLKNSNGCNVGAAPGIPREWVDAMATSRALPFEIWKEACLFDNIALHPAWRLFTGLLTEPASVTVRTIPVGGESPLGAVLLFSNPAEEASQLTPPAKLKALTSAASLAQLAIEHSRLYEDLQYRAYHDNLTGLPNNTLFEERLGDEVTRAKNLGTKIAVMMIGLDQFKQINDTMGRRAGDVLLIEVGTRLRKTLKQKDMVARLRGDEYSILIPDVSDSGASDEIAQAILDAVRRPCAAAGHTISATASIGVAVYPNDGADQEELQRAADAAMQCAKSLGGDRIQNFATRNDTLDRVRMDQELRVALREGRFTVHYQPQVGASGRFVALEALVRLNHPERGQIPPMQFIPVAEESGLIVPLGAWILNEVCRQVAEWQVRGFGNVLVAVNVSPVQISRPDFAKQVRECMARHNVLPSGIELELTEGLFIAGGQEAQRQMEELRSMGLRLSIDDFGTGYSSLSYLHKLQVDAIKLDRSFVQSIDTDKAANRLVQAMIGVAQGLGLNVVAEGVETRAQLAALIAAGCPMMQGYLFSRPMAACDIEGFLTSNASDTDDLIRLSEAVEVVPGVMYEAWPV